MANWSGLGRVITDWKGLLGLRLVGASSHLILYLLVLLPLQSRRGEQQELLYLDESRVMLKYLLPLNEVIVDFYDELKTQSSGYARFVLDCEQFFCFHQ